MRECSCRTLAWIQWVGWGKWRWCGIMQDFTFTGSRLRMYLRLWFNTLRFIDEVHCPHWYNSSVISLNVSSMIVCLTSLAVQVSVLPGHWDLLGSFKVLSLDGQLQAVKMLFQAVKCSVVPVNSMWELESHLKWIAVNISVHSSPPPVVTLMIFVHDVCCVNTPY